MPPWRWARSRAMARPRPVPLVAGAGVVEPDEALEDPLGVLGGHTRPVVAR
ncbi:hypothetical protein ACFQV4_29860 [Streptomyces thermocarboxydus]